MMLLRSRRAWLAWAKRQAFPTHFAGRATVPFLCEPDLYPCFAYAVLGSFAYEEERPEYLYESDIERMLCDIEVASAVALKAGVLR
jgi:hypothetical protein